MGLTLKEINSKEVWEGFLDKTQPSSFLHSWNWGVFNQETGHQIFRLGIYNGSELVSVALILKISARRGTFLFCPHGPIIQDLSQTMSVLTLLTEHLKGLAKTLGCAFIRISPLLKAGDENDKIFKNLGFKDAPVHMMHPELAWILPVAPSEDELLAGMRKTTRYSIKKAEKDGVTVRVSDSLDDFEEFYGVYQETVKRQQFAPFSKEYLKKEFEIFSKDDQARFFLASYNGEVIGAALIIFYGNSAFYHHGATTRKFSHLTDAQLLQWHAIKEAKKRSLAFYNFWGVVKEEEKNHPWVGLSIFKRGFGGFSEAYVHAKDLVISPRYWINFIVEKARKIKRGL